MNRLPLLLGLTLLLSACHTVPSVRKADAPQGYAAHAAAFTRVAQSAQTPADCPKNLPGTYTDLTCRQTEDGFCAFFANGKPFFCQAGPVSYRTNTWGSALTVTRRAQDKQLLSERYYADGRLARAQELDPQSHTLTTVWFESAQIRLTQTAPNGRVLDKFYFRPGKPFVRYPQGNDMGETNGTWSVDARNRLFLDGVYFYTLPQ